MSDEIICSECGRPNLPEAEKCWYCQALLKKAVQVVDGDEDVKATGDSVVDEHSPNELEPPKNDGDIPEWLKRVRELKKADQPEDEEEDTWRQQILFESQAKEKSTAKSSAGTKPRPRLPEDKPEIHIKEEEQPLLSQGLKGQDAESSLLETDDGESEPADPGDVELPDGFTPLDTNKG